MRGAEIPADGPTQPAGTPAARLTLASQAPVVVRPGPCPPGRAGAQDWLLLPGSMREIPARRGALVKRAGICLWGIDAAVREDLLGRALRGEMFPSAGAGAGRMMTPRGPTGRGPVWIGSLGGHQAVLKSHRHGGAPGWLLDRLPGDAGSRFPGLTRLCRSAAVAWEFLGRGGCTARPLGWLALGHRPFLRLFSATAAVVPSCSVERPLASTDRHQQRQALLALAQAVARWHHAGLSHKDLNLGNILVAEPGKDRLTPQDLVVIDLEGARILPRLSPGHRASALARMERSARKILGRDAVGDTPRRVFLLGYVLEQARLERRPRREAGLLLKELLPPLARRRCFLFLHHRPS